jgi:membrane-bound lytic murein transglycosylase D
MVVVRLLALVGFSMFAFAAAPAEFVRVLGARAAVAPVTDEPGDPQIERFLASKDDLWERIRAGFALPERRGRAIEAAEAWYAARPELVQAMLARAQPYLHYIVEEIERRGMPTELALLPLVESGFNPMAVSPAQAAGLWQFIPATASRYGLPQDKSYDARRDVIASTGAALDYLQWLHAMYGDWELALAAYNWGEMAVGRAVALSRARGGDGSFASLTLPEETRNYVPRLQAVKSLVAEPQRFGIELAKLSNVPYFAVVRLEKPLSLAAAAGFASMPLDELVVLNPGWSAPHSAAMRDVALVLPVERTAAFQARYASWLNARTVSRKPVRSAR